MATICGKCGATCADESQYCPSCGEKFAAIVTEEEATPSQPSRWGPIAAVVVSVAALIGMIVILIAFSGPTETVRYVMNAYRRGDATAMADKASVVTFGDVTGEDGFAGAYFAAIVDRDAAVFTDALGDGYALNYKIIDTASSAEETVVTVEIIAEGDTSTLVVEREVRLADEDGSWRVLSID